MKFRLPLTLATYILATSSLTSAPIESPVTGTVTATDSQTFDTLQVSTFIYNSNNNTVDVVGHLIIDLGTNSITATSFRMYGDNLNDGNNVATTTMKSGTLIITGAGTTVDNSLNIQSNNRHTGGADKARFIMQGGTVETNGIVLSKWNSGGTLRIEGGAIKTGRFDLGTTWAIATIEVLGGRLEIGTEGYNHSFDMDNNRPNNNNTLTFTGGTIAGYGNWTMGGSNDNDTLDERAQQVLNLKDTSGTPTFEVGAGYTVSLKYTLQGTGNGTFVKSGDGLLALKNPDNDFTQTVRIEGGTLGVVSESALGSASTIQVENDSAFLTSVGTISKNFNVAPGGRLTLWGRQGYDTNGTLATSPVNYTGTIELNGSSLRMDNSTVTIKAGQNVTGDELVLQTGSTLNVNGSVEFTTSTEGYTTLSLGMNPSFGGGSDGSPTVYRDTLNINAGGVFSANNARMTLSRWASSGTINIDGGTAQLKGIHLEGWAAQVNISNNGTLILGSDGIENNMGGRTDASQLSRITFNSGTIRFTENASYTETGAAGAGQANGYITLASDPRGRNIQVDAGRTATISGVMNGTGGFAKTGAGTLVLDSANLYTGETEIKEGILDLGNTGTLATQSIHVHNGTSFMGTWLSSYSGPLTVTGNAGTTAALWDGALTASALTLASGNALLSVNGQLTVNGDITVVIDPAQAQIGPMVSLSGANTVTLASGSKIIFNAANDALEDVGEGLIHLQLFNVSALQGLTTFNPATDIVWNRTDEKFVFETSNFLSAGTVSWYNSEISMDLLSIAQGNTTDTYAPRDNTVYVGARTDNVVFHVNKTYVSPDGSTRLTNGHGNFIFQPAVAGTGVLYARGMKDGSGKIWITNNHNAQQRTEVTDVTLVVDSSRGDAVVLPGDTPVGILGTGAVNLYGSSIGSGVLELRTGGDADRGDGSYVISNAITLNENTGILQSGGNSHLLTGDITLGYAAYGTITNESTRDLVLQSNFIGDPSTNLVFRGINGQVVLDGGVSPMQRAAGKSATLTQLNVEGAEGLLLTNGYTMTTDRVNVAVDSTFSMDGGAVLNLGSGGITEATVILGDATVNAQATSQSDSAMTLTGNTTFNVTGGETLTLFRGVTGTGSLAKTGEGKLVIARSDSPTTGTMNLYGGTLQLGLDTGTYLADGVTPLTAGYNLGGILNAESGTLAGAINANDFDIHFGSGSVFALGMDTTYHTSYIQNAGDITVDNGATLLVNVLEQGWTVATDYYIISANSAITGSEFQLALDGEFAFVDVHLTQTEKNVKLTLSAKVPDIALNTSNERAVFPVISDLVFKALDGRRGELRAELLNMMQIASKMKSDDLQAFVAETANSTASLYSALAGQIINTTQHVKSVRNRVTQLDPLLFNQYQETENRNIWVEGIGNYSDIDSDNNAPGFRLETWGINLGSSYSVSSEFFFGVGFSYTSAETRLKGSYGESDTDSYNMDLFGRYKKEAFSLTAVVTGGFSHVEYKRFMQFNGERLRANGKSNGSQVMGMIEAAYDFTLNESGTSILQPLVNVSTGFARFKGFDEKGDLGNAGYHVAAQDITPTTLGAGVRYIYSESRPDSYIPLRGELRAMVSQDVGDVTYNVQTNYLGASAQRMNVTGVPVERTAFSIGASGVLPIGLYTSLFVDVTGEFRDGQNSVSASAGINFQF